MGVYFNSRTTGPRDPITSSNQRLGSAFYRLSEEKQMEKLWLYVLSTPSGLELIYTKTRPKAPEKNLEGRPICSLHKKFRFLAPAKRN